MNTTTLVSTTQFITTTILNSTISLQENSTHHEDEEEEVSDGECCEQVIKLDTYIIILNIILALGLLGNILIFLAATDNFISSFSYSVYLRALAISDSLVLITTCTEDNLDYHDKLQDFQLSSVGLCKVWTGLLGTVAILSPWLVTLLTFDRYIGVVFPKLRAKFCTLRTAAFCVTVCIAVVLVTRIPDIALYTIRDVDDHQECIFDLNNEAFVNYGYVSGLGLGSSIPCILILTFNVHFVCIIRRYAANSDRISPDGGTYKGRVDRTTFSLMLVSILAFVTLVPKTMLEVIELAWTLRHDSEVTAAEEAGVEPPPYPGYLELANNTWPVLNLIYLVNFGQNFYILLFTNLAFRAFLKQKVQRLFCLSSARVRSQDADGKTDHDPVTTVSTTQI